MVMRQAARESRRRRGGIRPRSPASPGSETDARHFAGKPVLCPNRDGDPISGQIASTRYGHLRRWTVIVSPISNDMKVSPSSRGRHRSPGLGQKVVEGGRGNCLVGQHDKCVKAASLAWLRKERPASRGDMVRHDPMDVSFAHQLGRRAATSCTSRSAPAPYLITFAL